MKDFHVVSDYHFQASLYDNVKFLADMRGIFIRWIERFL